MGQAADLLARFSIHDIGVMIRQPIGHNTVGRHDAPRHRDGYVVDRERPRPPWMCCRVMFAAGARSPIGTPPLGGGFGTNRAEFGFR